MSCTDSIRNLVFLKGLIVMVIALFSVISVHFAFAIGTSPKVYPIDSKPFNTPYPEWIVKWTQWLTSIPNNNNPASDTSGIHCGTNQVGPVWYLAGTFGGSAERTCTIPKGKAILTPVLSGFCTYLTDPPKTESELLKCAREGNDGATIEASVDGVPVQNLQQSRITSALSPFVIPAENPYGFTHSGKTQAIVDGWFLFLEPLSSGAHTIHFSGSTVDNPTTGTQSYSTDATYHVNVQ